MKKINISDLIFTIIELNNTVYLFTTSSPFSAKVSISSRKTLKTELEAFKKVLQHLHLSLLELENAIPIGFLYLAVSQAIISTCVANGSVDVMRRQMEPLSTNPMLQAAMNSAEQMAMDSSREAMIPSLFALMHALRVVIDIYHKAYGIDKTDLLFDD